MERVQTDYSNRLPAVDVVMVIDESSSMDAGKDFLLSRVVRDLDAELQRHNVGMNSSLPNRYAIVGFGQRLTDETYRLHLPHHYQTLDSRIFYSASEFHSVAVDNLDVDHLGDKEDGYLALDYVIKQLPLRLDPRVAIQVVLITNEDRDVTPEGANVTRAQLRRWFRHNDAYLNVMVDNDLAWRTRRALGGDNHRTYVATRSGSFRELGDPVIVNRGFERTSHDYVELALRTGGTAWDYNYLRGNEKSSLRAAFISSMARQAVFHGQECETCTCVDDGSAGTMNCHRLPHQTRCKCEKQGGQVSIFCVSFVPFQANVKG